MANPPAASASQPIFDLGSRLKTCHAIASILTRGQCYDQVVEDYNLNTLRENDVATTPGKWKVSLEKSPVDDSQNVYMSLMANDYIQRPDGKYVRPALILRCAQGVGQGYVAWDKTVTDGPDVTINTRFGNSQIFAARWKLSSDKQATFIPDAAAFTALILKVPVFYIKAAPLFADPMDATFDVRGLENAMAPMRQACHW